MNKIIAIILSGCIVFVSAGIAQADGLRTATSGVIACGGNQLIRNGGGEIHRTNFIIRNFNNVEAINIERIRVYNASGVLIRDYTETELPSFSNGVMGPMDNTLDSFQTAQLSTREFFGESGLAANERPLQVVFDWRAYSPVKPPQISLVRTVRDRIVTLDALGNQLIKEGAERSRHSSDCSVLELRRD